MSFKCKDCVHYSWDQDVEVMTVFCDKNYFNGNENDESIVKMLWDAHKKNTTPCEGKDFQPN
jgi:hypothetical protein